MHSILVISTLTIDWLNSLHALTFPFFIRHTEGKTRYVYAVSFSAHLRAANNFSMLFIDRKQSVCICLSCCTPLNQFQYYYFVCPFVLSSPFFLLFLSLSLNCNNFHTLNSVCRRPNVCIANANICTNKFFGDFFYIFEIYYFSASSRQSKNKLNQRNKNASMVWRVFKIFMKKERSNPQDLKRNVKKDMGFGNE